MKIVVTTMADNLFCEVAPFILTRKRMRNIDEIRMQI